MGMMQARSRTEMHEQNKIDEAAAEQIPTTLFSTPKKTLLRVRETEGGKKQATQHANFFYTSRKKFCSKRWSSNFFFVVLYTRMVRFFRFIRFAFSSGLLPSVFVRCVCAPKLDFYLFRYIRSEKNIKIAHTHPKKNAKNISFFYEPKRKKGSH